MAHSFLRSLLPRHVLRVQPDNGTICAYWVSALISMIDVASGTGMEYRSVALQALCVALYLHMGRLVPRSQRRRLCRVLNLELRHGIGGNRAANCGSHGRSVSGLMTAAAVSLTSHILDDAAFAALTGVLPSFAPFVASDASCLAAFDATAVTLSQPSVHAPCRCQTMSLATTPLRCQALLS
jgi:hypothetical protein